MKKILGTLTAVCAIVGLSVLPASATTVPNNEQVATQQVGNDCEVQAFRPYSFRQGLNVTIKFRVAYNCWPVPRWILAVDQPQKLVGATWKNTGKATIHTKPSSGETLVATIDCANGTYRTLADLTNEKGADHSVTPGTIIKCDV